MVQEPAHRATTLNVNSCSKYGGKTHLFHPECAHVEVGEDVGAVEPHFNLVVSAVRVVPVLLTLLLQNTK